MKEKKKIGTGFGVMLMKDDKLLLGRRHDDPEKASSLLNGAGTWTMPGGNCILEKLLRKVQKEKF